LPVSAIPADGTYPNGTTKWEKRNISEKVAIGMQIFVFNVVIVVLCVLIL
jgi:hypothetical protein